MDADNTDRVSANTSDNTASAQSCPGRGGEGAWHRGQLCRCEVASGFRLWMRSTATGVCWWTGIGGWWHAGHSSTRRSQAADHSMTFVVAVQLTSDAGLRALLTEASTGNQLAARVVLQAMLGRMVRMALRDPKASIDDYLSALWCQIQTYPLASRPDRIAANLSMDTFKSLRNDQRWLHRAEVLIWAPQMFLDEFAQGAPCHVEPRRYRVRQRDVGRRHSASRPYAPAHRCPNPGPPGERLSGRARSPRREPAPRIHSRIGAGALQSGGSPTRGPCPPSRRCCVNGQHQTRVGQHRW